MDSKKLALELNILVQHNTNRVLLKLIVCNRNRLFRNKEASQLAINEIGEVNIKLQSYLF
jgi:sulfate adenylyltransferase subunit 1